MDVYEIYDVISGKSKVSHGELIQTISCHLRNGKEPSSPVERTKSFKTQEAKNLRAFIDQNSLWLKIDHSQYISEGAEQKVYLKGNKHVIKLNDAIYYECWQDYFYNLLLHNFFFPDTAYQLLGFNLFEDKVYAVVLQKYVKINKKTTLSEVKLFLKENDFVNSRRNDYFHPPTGIILEDLHDENVLNSNGILYFIDTVFYLSSIFWQNLNQSQ